MMHSDKNINDMIMTWLGYYDGVDNNTSTKPLYRSSYVKTIAREAKCCRINYAISTGALLEPATKVKLEDIPERICAPRCLTLNPIYLSTLDENFVLRLLATKMLFHNDTISISRIDNIIDRGRFKFTIEDVFNYFDGDPNLIE